MSKPSLLEHTLPNGLTVLIEHLPAVRSAALTLMIPAGASHEAVGKNGTSAILSELMLRGAGVKDSRELSIALDNLGVQHSLSPGWHHLTLSAATLASRLPEALNLIASIILEPQLDQEQFEMCLVGRQQVLRSIEDEPKQKLMIELRKRCYPPPWNRPLEGTLEHLENISIEDLKQHYRRCCVPAGAILGIAGFVDIDETLAQCIRLFGRWSGLSPGMASELEGRDQAGHITHDSTQTHIGIAYPTVPVSHPQYYEAWAAVSILSGGMSSRLFTKVREERGLCYAIGASINSLKDQARVLCYAGTTNERAQETLDVTLHELQSFGTDITPEELQRCQARAKSSLIMQEESSMSRSGALARDWFHLKRVTSPGEIRSKLEALSANSVQEFTQQHSAEKFQVLTIGPEPLQCNGQSDISDL